MNDNRFDNNYGIMIYSSYLSLSVSKNNILDLNMNDNIFNNHTNTGIVLQSNTKFPSRINIININVESSTFGSNSFIILYPNINSNIKIMNSIFNDNNGSLITSKVDNYMDYYNLFNNCLDQYSIFKRGIWIIDTQFNS